MSTTKAAALAILIILLLLSVVYLINKIRKHQGIGITVGTVITLAVAAVYTIAQSPAEPQIIAANDYVPTEVIITSSEGLDVFYSTSTNIDEYVKYSGKLSIYEPITISAYTKDVFTAKSKTVTFRLSEQMQASMPIVSTTSTSIPTVTPTSTPSPISTATPTTTRMTIVSLTTTPTSKPKATPTPQNINNTASEIVAYMPAPSATIYITSNNTFLDTPSGKDLFSLPSNIGYFQSFVRQSGEKSGENAKKTIVFEDNSYSWVPSHSDNKYIVVLAISSTFDDMSFEDVDQYSLTKTEDAMSLLEQYYVCYWFFVDEATLSISYDLWREMSRASYDIQGYKYSVTSDNMLRFTYPKVQLGMPLHHYQCIVVFTVD